MFDTVKRWAPLLIVGAIVAPLVLGEGAELAALPLLAWGVLKVAAFGVLGLALDRFAAPGGRPHVLNEERTAALQLHYSGQAIDPAVVAQAMRSVDAANLRRAVTILGCQIAGALL